MSGSDLPPGVSVMDCPNCGLPEGSPFFDNGVPNDCEVCIHRDPEITGNENPYLRGMRIWPRKDRARRSALLGEFDDDSFTISRTHLHEALDTVDALSEAVEDLSTAIERGGELEDMTREEAIAVLLEARDRAVDARGLLKAVQS